MARTFTLLRTLGRGAHGAVHLAEVRDEDDYVQTLAVKRLLPQWSDDADLVARLKDEARLLALLRHDHVVRVHGLTRIDGALAILMEPVDGVDLGTLVEQVGSLPPRVAVQVVEAVADALDAAWCTVPPGQRGPLHVVHRDIKPSNVMVTPRGGVKVMDFGVARATFEAREVETRSQQYGTARYMAPERWLQGEAVHASDVFALGITLCEVASGRQVPRPRLSPELFASDVEEAVRTLPPELADLVRAMTTFAHEERPTAAEVAERCRVLLTTVEGPSLRVWAASQVRPGESVQLDPTATGTVVAEEAITREPTRAIAAIAPPRRVLPWWLVPALAAAFLVVPVGRHWPAGSAVRTEVLAHGAPPSARAVATPVVAALSTPEEPPVAVVAIPIAPTPAPELRRIRAVPPAVEPAPEPTPVPTVPVRFTLEQGLTAETDHGRIARSPQVVHLPARRTLEVRVDEGGHRWTCQITTGAGSTEVRVRGGSERGCSQQ